MKILPACPPARSHPWPLNYDIFAAGCSVNGHSVANISIQSDTRDSGLFYEFKNFKNKEEIENF